MTIFEHLKYQPADEFNDIRQKLRTDTSAGKIDVSSGVYRGLDGRSYLLPSVEKAKKVMDKGHDYQLCLGIPDFIKTAQKIALNDKVIEEGLVASCQSVGGTGALYLGCEFLAKFCGYKQFYLGTPAWPNYESIISQGGGVFNTYNYYDAVNKRVDFESVVSALESAPEKSVFILQVCCHNPTGSDLSIDQWTKIGEIMKQKKLIPFLDAAYQGFATGSKDVDGKPIKIFLELGIEMLVAQSFSKNLGLYGERVGCLHVITTDKKDTPVVSDQLRYMFRAECSHAPSFGAKIVYTVAQNDELNEQWSKDLIDISGRLIKLRETIYNSLVEKKTPGDWTHVKTQRGLFWYSGLTQRQSEYLLNELHVYALKSGRINVASLNDDNIELFCEQFDKAARY